MVQQWTTNGSTTLIYLGNLEELSIPCGGTSTTSYYYANGQRIALNAGGTIFYLGNDVLGSPCSERHVPLDSTLLGSYAHRH